MIAFISHSTDDSSPALVSTPCHIVFLVPEELQLQTVCSIFRLQEKGKQELRPGTSPGLRGEWYNQLKDQIRWAGQINNDLVNSEQQIWLRSLISSINSYFLQLKHIHCFKLSLCLCRCCSKKKTKQKHKHKHKPDKSGSSSDAGFFFSCFEPKRKRLQLLPVC